MAFKVDESFLRFLTMGAAGTRAVAGKLIQRRHHIIELERYTTSNKIWATKIKRLRVPDLLCVACGTRFEVRAKSDLELKVSDSPDNPERRWDVGLRDEDIVAFIACLATDDDKVIPSEHAWFFHVASMRATQHLSKLGPPKSAAEGAERDREWPTWAPTRDGAVEEVSAQYMRVKFADGRNYKYQLKGKKPYCQPGNAFRAGESILAGVVDPVDPICSSRSTWNLAEALCSEASFDRYCAVKAAGDVGIRDVGDQLASKAKGDPEPRVALEAAASLAKLGDDRGSQLLREAYDAAADDAWRMEVVLILSEIDAEWASEELFRIAQRDPAEEIVAACVWGLAFGRRPVREKILPFLSHDSNDVVIHAVIALARTMRPAEVRHLTEALGGAERLAAAAAEVLARGPDFAISALLAVAFDTGSPASAREWAQFALGRRDEGMCRAAATQAGLELEKLRVLTPMWRGLSRNWMTKEVLVHRLRFVERQVS